MRMRFSFLIALALMMSIGSAQAAKVLVPGDNKTDSNAGSSASTLGLVPKAQTPAPTTTTPQAQPTPPATPATMPPIVAEPKTSPPENTSGLDKFSPELMTSLKMDEVRKGLSNDLKGLSDNDLMNLLKYGAEHNKDEKSSSKQTQTSVQLVTGGAKIAPKERTAMDDQLDKIAKKFGGPGAKTSSAFDRGVAMARAKEEKEEQQRYRDPVFLPDMKMASFDSPLLNSTMQVGVNKDYTWGQSAVGIINRVLGYTDEEILSRCQLRANIFFKTDDKKPLYQMALYSNTANTIKFNGKLESIEVVPMAVCLPPAKAMPRRGGIIFKVGDKFGLTFRRSKCPAPEYDPKKKPLEAALISYEGDEKLVCQFK